VSVPIADAPRVDRDIVPLFHCRERGATPQLVRFAGTGFRLGGRLLVTCWHCVAGDAPGHFYAAAFPNGVAGFELVPLRDVMQDENGADLATASLAEHVEPPLWDLELGPRPLTPGEDVWAYGYPLTPEIAAQDDPRALRLSGRLLDGHMTRTSRYIHPPFGKVRCYETDLPAPAGLSGAPLLRRPGRAVVGVLYARKDAAATKGSPASADPAEGPASFALAQHTEALHALRGAATEGLRLVDYLVSLEPRR
jgi:hypothetical protein